ncbi:hypothetical protein [Pectobacterium punjabense]|uniref:hypothetical protein n=1 Tax=Pectobacterium punjabense TaxID=2108399 RepID=UPI0037F38CE1
MLTKQKIEEGKKAIKQKDHTYDGFHEDDGCIHIAYEWLDAQKKLQTPNKRTMRPIKHLIERWAGRYVSTADVQVAAHLHPDITGAYPFFNISTNLVEPNTARLEKIKIAFSQPDYRNSHKENDYKRKEI